MSDMHQRVTRSKMRHMSKMDKYRAIEDAEEQELITGLHGELAKNEAVINESFYGVFHLIDDQGDSNAPVLLIIKNIKAFPHTVLNELVHELKKYRGAPYKLKLNLILGVQNNNTDEFHLRVKIQNAVKMTVKKFMFPSMRNIILEVVNQLIMSKDMALTFDHDVVQNLIEQINLYGMSVTKFRRVLRTLLATHFLMNEFFFVHNTPVSLLSHKQFLKSMQQDQVQKQIMEGFNRYYPSSKVDSLTRLEEVFREVKCEEQAQVTGAMGFVEELVGEVREFSKAKRKWFKAYEVMEEIVLMAQELGHNNEKYIYRYQFLLNFLSKKAPEDRVRYLEQQLQMVRSYSHFIHNQVIPLLTQRRMDVEHIEKKRASTFIGNELQELLGRLDGSYTFYKQVSIN